MAPGVHFVTRWSPGAIQVSKVDLSLPAKQIGHFDGRGNSWVWALGVFLCVFLCGRGMEVGFVYRGAPSGVGLVVRAPQKGLPRHHLERGRGDRFPPMWTVETTFVENVCL